jgi:GntR family transcriptional regulator
MPEASQTSPDGGAGRLPLWKDIQDQLRARMARGDFADGFPGEMALMKEYGVSRATVRSALAPMRREGLISAHRGRPSAVVNVDGEQRFGPVYSLFAAVEDAGMKQHSVVNAARVRTNPLVAARLGLGAKAKLVFISRTRMADGEVFAVDDTWLLPSAAAILDADLTRTALYEVLTDLCGITLSAGTETLHAIATNAAQSGRLNCRRGTAAFFIERLGMAGNRPVEWRETIVRGDRFTVTTAYPTNH